MAAVPRCVTDDCRCQLRNAEEIGRGTCSVCHTISEEALKPYTALADADDMIVSVHRDAVRFEDLGFQFFDEVPRTLVDTDSVHVSAQFCREPSTPAGPPIRLKVDATKVLVKMTPTFVGAASSSTGAMDKGWHFTTTPSK